MRTCTYVHYTSLKRYVQASVSIVWLVRADEDVVCPWKAKVPIIKERHREVSSRSVIEHDGHHRVYKRSCNTNWIQTVIKYSKGTFAQ